MYAMQAILMVTEPDHVSWMFWQDRLNDHDLIWC